MSTLSDQSWLLTSCLTGSLKGAFAWRDDSAGEVELEREETEEEEDANPEIWLKDSEGSED